MAKFSRHPKELKGPALNGGRCCNHDKGVTVLIFQGNAGSRNIKKEKRKHRKKRKEAKNTRKKNIKVKVKARRRQVIEN